MSDPRFKIIVVLAGLLPLAAVEQLMAANPAQPPAVSAAADGSAQANARLVALPPNHSPVDSELIRHAPGADGAAGAAAEPASQSVELTRVGGALAIVIALIFGLRWGGRKLFGSAIAGHSNKAVQVLARSPLSARQSILLLRIGRRVIVVGDSGAQMNALTEISDPDEVASLIGQLRDNRPTYSAGAFGRLFHRAAEEMNFEESESTGDRDESMESSESVSADAGIDPAIDETREELSGLMEKIRSLSRNFPGRAG